MKNDLVTIQNAARSLSVSVRTALSHIKQGYLKAVKIGGIKKAGRVYIPKAEIDRLLKAK